jgi:hypothetical protein
VLKLFLPAEYRSSARGIPQEDGRQATRHFPGYLLNR